MIAIRRGNKRWDIKIENFEIRDRIQGYKLLKQELKYRYENVHIEYSIKR